MVLHREKIRTGFLLREDRFGVVILACTTGIFSAVSDESQKGFTATTLGLEGAIYKWVNLRRSRIFLHDVIFF